VEDNLENDSVDNDQHFHYIDDKNSYFCLKGEKDNAMFICLSRFFLVVIIFMEMAKIKQMAYYLLL